MVWLSSKLEISKAKDCWTLVSKWPSDELCIFDTVLVRYRERDGNAILQCSRYFTNANTIVPSYSRNRFWNVNTGVDTVDSAYDPNFFFEYTRVVEDTLLSFYHPATPNPNACASYSVSVRGRRDPDNRFKAQIQQCDALGFKIF